MIESIFTEADLAKMHLIRSFESRDREARLIEHPFSGRTFGVESIETGYKFTVHASGGGGWYEAVKHEYAWNGRGWELTNGEVACHESLKLCLASIRVL